MILYRLTLILTLGWNIMPSHSAPAYAVPAVADAQARELAMVKQQTVVVQPEPAGVAYAGPPVGQPVQVAVPVQQGAYAQPVPAGPGAQVFTFDDRPYVAVADQYKKTAERYYAEFNQNAQVMTNSLKNIENIVVDVLNDQTQQKIMDSAGLGSISRYKREAEEDKLFLDAQRVQKEFVENEQKMTESLKEMDELIAERIKYRNEESNRVKREAKDEKALDDGTFIDDVNMVVKVTNKDNRDMWEVSNFLLEDGVRKSILEAIKADLQLTDPDDIKGIDASMKKTFLKIRDEAVHVDKPDWMKHEKKSKHDVITAKVPIAYDPKKN